MGWAAGGWEGVFDGLGGMIGGDGDGPKFGDRYLILSIFSGCLTSSNTLDLSDLASHKAKDAFIAVSPRDFAVSRASLFEKPSFLRHRETLLAQ